jgi:hypothetical protein
MAFAVFAVIALIAAGSAQNPGFQIALTNKGLEYAREVSDCGVKRTRIPQILPNLETGWEQTTNAAHATLCKVALPILVHDLQTMSIPDIHGSAGTPIGSISYDLTGIHVTGVNVPQSAITVGTSGLTVSLGGVSISMNAHWCVV